MFRPTRRPSSGSTSYRRQYIIGLSCQMLRSHLFCMAIYREKTISFVAALVCLGRRCGYSWGRHLSCDVSPYWRLLRQWCQCKSVVGMLSSRMSGVSCPRVQWCVCSSTCCVLTYLHCTFLSQGCLLSFITLLLMFLYKFRNIRCVCVICAIIQICSAK